MFKRYISLICFSDFVSSISFFNLFQRFRFVDLFLRFVSAISFRRLVFLFSAIITSHLHNRPMFYLLCIYLLSLVSGFTLIYISSYVHSYIRFLYLHFTLASNTRKSQMAGSKIAPDQSVFLHKLWLVL